MAKKCLLFEDKPECDDCGACDRCELYDRICINCFECLQMPKDDYAEIVIDHIEGLDENGQYVPGPKNIN